MLRLPNIKIGLDDDEAALTEAIVHRLNIKERDLLSYQISKKSIDARKHTVNIVYTVDFEVRHEQKIFNKHRHLGLTRINDTEYQYVKPGSEKMNYPPVIIGTGPSGLFAGLLLAQMGYRPVLLERGDEVENRSRKVETFWQGGVFDRESNVQFGEGGAGTFSDGKLTTLTRDQRIRKVLEEFVQAGAPGEILYLNKPHIGTDVLKTVVKKLRQEIIGNGGEVRFRSRVTDFEIVDNRINALIINGTERMVCRLVVLGIGHSARDTFAILHQRGVHITPKPFSLGVRIEHPQALIDASQYGAFTGHAKLGPADYKLVYHASGGRSAYTFCMCPGGYVIASGSEDGGIVTNGMSEYRRNGRNANSALLVGVKPEDYESHHPLAGVEFQRKWERLAFDLAGGSYQAPVQLVGDFLADRPSTRFGTVFPTYKPGVVFAGLKHCLPDYVTDTIKKALASFENKIQGFTMPDAVLTGVETRSSSPVRINRDDNYVSNIEGLYPVGEGAGYAGGIMSSAVDGIRAAEKIVARYSPTI